MKIYLDSANLDEIQKWNDIGVIGGVTTNIKLLSVQNVTDYPEHMFKIAEIVNAPVSFELQEEDFMEMYETAKNVSNWHHQMVVKVPMFPSGQGIRLLKMLKNTNIRTNTTWVTSLSQAIMALQAGTNYISYFWSRAYKDNTNAFTDVQALRRLIKDNFCNTKIIAASIHNELEFKEAIKAGADIVTVSGMVLQEILSSPATLNIKHEREEYYANP